MGYVRTLRLTHSSDGPDQHRVEIALEGGSPPRQTAVSRLPFALSAQDREDLRWYLEDFLQYPLDPAPTIAARIEQHMAAIGVDLFNAIFQSNADARDLWANLRGELNDTRVEIVTGVREATALPWELLRDPKTDAALALEAQSFVRASSQPARRPRLPQSASGPIRILLAICRPGGRDDVPFRSVASRLLKGLSEAPPAPLMVSAETEDPHAAVRAFGSLAQEVVGTGAAGVVAMRYNVYVETAAQFMADLYGPLGQGQSLGEAVSLSRKQLAGQPLRDIAYDPRPLQDWPVPGG